MEFQRLVLAGSHSTPQRRLSATQQLGIYILCSTAQQSHQLPHTSGTQAPPPRVCADKQQSARAQGYKPTEQNERASGFPAKMECGTPVLRTSKQLFCALVKTSCSSSTKTFKSVSHLGRSCVTLGEAAQSHTGPPVAFEKLFEINEPKTREIIAASFTKILRDGPLVSFSGSPTVSPVTAFLCV